MVMGESNELRKVHKTLRSEMDGERLKDDTYVIPMRPPSTTIHYRDDMITVYPVYNNSHGVRSPLFHFLTDVACKCI